MFQMMNHFNPTIECIALLNRHFSQIPNEQNTLRSKAEQIAEEHNIPINTIIPTIEPLIQIESHVIEGLQPFPPQARRLFSCTEGLFANFAWALYFFEEEQIDFASLTGEEKLSELHHLLSIALNTVPDALKQVRDLSSLADFLEQQPVSDTMKWDCTLFWRQPTEYQAIFREILSKAIVLFREIENVAAPLLEQFLPDIQNMLISEQGSNVMQLFSQGNFGTITVHPFAAHLQGFGIIWDHVRPGAKNSVLLVSLLRQHISNLALQFSNNSALIANGAKALGDQRRVEILKALAKEPLCNLELSNLLNLSAATVAHHMGQLLRENFVATSRQGNRVDYSICTDKLQLFADSVLSIFH